MAKGNGTNRMKTNYDNRQQPASAAPAPTVTVPPVLTPSPAEPPIGGLRCPNLACRSRFSRVVNSYLVENGRVRMRQRVCEKCGTSWNTKET